MNDKIKSISTLLKIESAIVYTDRQNGGRTIAFRGNAPRTIASMKTNSNIDCRESIKHAFAFAQRAPCA
ncbi:MAG: hypothetical protein D6680_08145 [Cyanobacteria bacterium J007]|nr:MAG: hypothetical protein D6680_08145 [Cyanobacteria bacterium J007]